MTNKTQDQYTSLELSKKLKDAGCFLPAGGTWLKNDYGDKDILATSGHDITMATHGNEIKGETYGAYDIMNDICCKYFEDFFGDDELGFAITTRILNLMQQGDKSGAEKYIIDNSILFNKKGE